MMEQIYPIYPKQGGLNAHIVERAWFVRARCKKCKTVIAGPFQNKMDAEKKINGMNDDVAKGYEIIRLKAIFEFRGWLK